MNRSTLFLLFLLLVFLLTDAVHANNLKISGPWEGQQLALTDQNTGTGQVLVRFDISWENSWRKDTDMANWDACWIFVKYRKNGSSEWHHATLGNRTDVHTIPTGASLSVGTTDNAGKGVFLYRSENGDGTVYFQNIGLLWEYGKDKVGNRLAVELQVMGIEMVYIPEGKFEIGTTTTKIQDAFYGEIFGSFEGADTNSIYDNSSFQIDGEHGLYLGGKTAGSLGNNNAVNMYTPDDFNDTTAKWLPDAFPKGYQAFYIMKYEITQGQYVDFLNLLSTEQKITRSNADLNDYRNVISGYISSGYSTVRPDRACNYLSWADGTAYADWCGLRPFTELEFEKACRGTNASIPDEYAWGTTNDVEAVDIIGTPEDGTETVRAEDGQYANANCYVDGFVGGDVDGTTQNSQGPLRAGIFAASGDGSREQSGASFYGVMELSGNVIERVISIGSRKGRSFAGTHGDGELNVLQGDSNVETWPRVDAVGSGFRGGHLFRGRPAMRVSDRRYAAHVLDYRRAQYSRGSQNRPLSILLFCRDKDKSKSYPHASACLVKNTSK